MFGIQRLYLIVGDKMKRALTFDDVALVPQYNNVQSRTVPNLSTYLTKTTRVEMPLIPANMDTVISVSLAEILIEHGSFPIVHRFMTFEQKLEWINKFGSKMYLSCGAKESDVDEIFRLYEKTQDHSFRGVCLDIAHGHSEIMLRTLDWCKKKMPNVEVIAGNVCTGMAYQDLVNAGADAVKVGIGPGAACTTRVVTGFGVPQFTAIQECYEVAKRLRVPLIADGGIRNSRDVSLALAAGASTVMMGKLFSMTFESASPKKFVYDNEIQGDRCFSSYRGQASEAFQKDFYGELKKGTVAEGVSMETEITKSANEIIDELLGGVRSAMTYGGAKNITEFQQKAEFVEVTHNYMTESRPRV